MTLLMTDDDASFEHWLQENAPAALVDYDEHDDTEKNEVVTIADTVDAVLASLGDEAFDIKMEVVGRSGARYSYYFHEGLEGFDAELDSLAGRTGATEWADANREPFRFVSVDDLLEQQNSAPEPPVTHFVGWQRFAAWASDQHADHEVMR